MTENKLGKRIKERRQSLRLTQSQLAERTGYKDKTAISRIESGENDLTQSKIMAFADALQTTPSYLMGWVEEPRPKTAKENRVVRENNRCQLIRLERRMPTTLC